MVKKQCILTTVMYIWRHDICHVTASRWCHIWQNVSPISDNRYAEAIFAIGIIKKVTEEKRRGVPSPLGVRGLSSNLMRLRLSIVLQTLLFCARIRLAIVFDDYIFHFFHFLSCRTSYLHLSCYILLLWMYETAACLPCLQTVWRDHVDWL